MEEHQENADKYQAIVDGARLVASKMPMLSPASTAFCRMARASSGGKWWNDVNIVRSPLVNRNFIASTGSG